jgi:hypothetical protein
LRDAKEHTVRRRPIYCMDALGNPGQSKRFVERDGMTDCPALTFWRDDGHRPQRPHRVCKRVESARHDPIIICHEDVHRASGNKKSCPWQLSTAAGTAAASTWSSRPSKRRGEETSPAVLVGASRFERPTSRTPSECATRLRYAPTLLCSPARPSAPRRASLGFHPPTPSAPRRASTRGRGRGCDAHRPRPTFSGHRSP